MDFERKLREKLFLLARLLVVHLRCIERNGDRDAFIRCVADDHHRRGRLHAERIRIQHAARPPYLSLALLHDWAQSAPIVHSCHRLLRRLHRSRHLSIGFLLIDGSG